MQFIDLAKQQSFIREKLEKRIRNVLDHGSYIMGPEVRELEKAIAEGHTLIAYGVDFRFLDVGARHGLAALEGEIDVDLNGFQTHLMLFPRLPSMNTAMAAITTICA